MTENERVRKIADGKLWYDTEEYLAHQARVKDLVYDFNMSRPGEKDKREELMRKIFGEVGKDVFIRLFS